MKLCLGSSLSVALLSAALFLWGGQGARAQPTTASEHSTTQPIVVEVFVRGDKPSADRVARFVRSLQEDRPGLQFKLHDLLTDREQLRRFYQLAQRVGRETPVLPAFFACDRMYFGFVDAKTSGPAISDLWTMHVYTRATCPRCQQFKAFVPRLEQQWPGLVFAFHDVDQSTTARRRWESLCRAAGSPPGLPTIDFARRVLVGYRGDDVTGAQLRRLIERVSDSAPSPARPSPNDNSLWRPPMPKPHRASFLPSGVGDVVAPPVSGDPPPLALPDEADDSEVGETRQPVAPAGDDSIEVPWLGRLSASELGLPLFTLAVGLVDGFNPCAMWVLVFLLSVLVNIKDRRKIVVIAGTFVVISGVAYYAFMAAWLNVFVLVGLKRPVQIVLALLALVIGVINIKDFFFFKRGITLSIPESRKPGLYRRVRAIATAKYLSVALSGAVVLAVIVNLIELLCTAGLPALYTQVLSMQELPSWQNYAYLGLYILAYMLDDATLVAIVVATLSHRRLQEQEGRWLKLLSGLVILLLGLVMLFKPGWLHPSP
jgi:hypothetical protein